MMPTYASVLRKAPVAPRIAGYPSIAPTADHADTMPLNGAGYNVGYPMLHHPMAEEPAKSFEKVLTYSENEARNFWHLPEDEEDWVEPPLLSNTYHQRVRSTLKPVEAIPAPPAVQEDGPSSLADLLADSEPDYLPAPHPQQGHRWRQQPIAPPPPPVGFHQFEQANDLRASFERHLSTVPMRQANPVGPPVPTNPEEVAPTFPAPEEEEEDGPSSLADLLADSEPDFLPATQSRQVNKLQQPIAPPQQGDCDMRPLPSFGRPLPALPVISTTHEPAGVIAVAPVKKEDGPSALADLLADSEPDFLQAPPRPQHGTNKWQQPIAPPVISHHHHLQGSHALASLGNALPPVPVRQANPIAPPARRLAQDLVDDAEEMARRPLENLAVDPLNSSNQHSQGAHTLPPVPVRQPNPVGPPTRRLAQDIVDEVAEITRCHMGQTVADLLDDSLPDEASVARPLAPIGRPARHCAVSPKPKRQSTPFAPSHSRPSSSVVTAIRDTGYREPEDTSEQPTDSPVESGSSDDDENWISFPSPVARSDSGREEQKPTRPQLDTREQLFSSPLAVLEKNENRIRIVADSPVQAEDDKGNRSRLVSPTESEQSSPTSTLVRAETPELQKAPAEEYILSEAFYVRPKQQKKKRADSPVKLQSSSPSIESPISSWSDEENPGTAARYNPNDDPFLDEKDKDRDAMKGDQQVLSVAFESWRKSVRDRRIIERRIAALVFCECDYDAEKTCKPCSQGIMVSLIKKGKTTDSGKCNNDFARTSRVNAGPTPRKSATQATTGKAAVLPSCYCDQLGSTDGPCAVCTNVMAASRESYRQAMSKTCPCETGPCKDDCLAASGAGQDPEQRRLELEELAALEALALLDKQREAMLDRVERTGAARRRYESTRHSVSVASGSRGGASPKAAGDDKSDAEDDGHLDSGYNSRRHSHASSGNEKSPGHETNDTGHRTTPPPSGENPEKCDAAPAREFTLPLLPEIPINAGADISSIIEDLLQTHLPRPPSPELLLSAESSPEVNYWRRFARLELSSWDVAPSGLDLSLPTFDRPAFVDIAADQDDNDSDGDSDDEDSGEDSDDAREGDDEDDGSDDESPSGDEDGDGDKPESGAAKEDVQPVADGASDMMMDAESEGMVDGSEIEQGTEIQFGLVAGEVEPAGQEDTFADSLATVESADTPSSEVPAEDYYPATVPASTAQGFAVLPSTSPAPEAAPTTVDPVTAEDHFPGSPTFHDALDNPTFVARRKQRLPPLTFAPKATQEFWQPTPEPSKTPLLDFCKSYDKGTVEDSRNPMYKAFGALARAQKDRDGRRARSETGSDASFSFPFPAADSDAPLFRDGHRRIDWGHAAADDQWLFDKEEKGRMHLAMGLNYYDRQPEGYAMVRPRSPAADAKGMHDLYWLQKKAGPTCTAFREHRAKWNLFDIPARACILSAAMQSALEYDEMVESGEIF